ncbi:hypothetical protein FRX31_004167 [Thalictrum thalictroides]|uniref:Uncharacterized protein n=1 Tax=Thalictrum thalictroides TaxID=46969 RepID=A0A7J6XBM9_THATH|nr:hypothetical protein FRX31_004167 [Thalictrum thalictroides]
MVVPHLSIWLVIVTPLMGVNCQVASNGIQSCQGQGVKVMLSIGRGSGIYSIASAVDARQVVDN